MPSDAFAMSNKHNVVLYLDKDLVEKSKELGFNLRKPFENHLKNLEYMTRVIGTRLGSGPENLF